MCSKQDQRANRVLTCPSLYVFPSLWPSERCVGEWETCWTCGRPGCGRVVGANPRAQGAEVRYAVDADACAQRLGFTPDCPAQTAETLGAQRPRAAAGHTVWVLAAVFLDFFEVMQPGRHIPVIFASRAGSCLLLAGIFLKDRWFLPPPRPPCSSSRTPCSASHRRCGGRESCANPTFSDEFIGFQKILLWYSMLFNLFNAAAPAAPSTTEKTKQCLRGAPRPVQQPWWETVSALCGACSSLAALGRADAALEVVWGGTECACAENSRGILVTPWNGENCLIFQRLACDPTLP